MLFVVGVVVVLVVIYIYVNDYKHDYNPNYKLQCIVPSQYLYVNNYKTDYNPDYKPNYKLQCIFSITIPTSNGKTSWVPMMFCQSWQNIMGTHDVMPKLAKHQGGVPHATPETETRHLASVLALRLGHMINLHSALYLLAHHSVGFKCIFYSCRLSNSGTCFSTDPRISNKT